MANVDEFFHEQVIRLELSDGQELRVFMRPMKVKEIGIASRVAAIQKEDVPESEYLPFLIQLVEQAVNVDIDNMPMTILEKLIDVFIELNFGDEKQSGKDPGKLEIIMPNKLAIAFDFLISQGHSYQDILEYTLPQIRMFQQVAVDRLTGVKKEDPVKALTKAGVVLKHK